MAIGDWRIGGLVIGEDWEFTNSIEVQSASLMVKMMMASWRVGAIINAMPRSCQRTMFSLGV